MDFAPSPNMIFLLIFLVRKTIGYFGVEKWFLQYVLFYFYVAAVQGGQLFASSICMSSQQAAGVHYNLHNLYGFMETINTNKCVYL